MRSWTSFYVTTKVTGLTHCVVTVRTMLISYFCVNCFDVLSQMRAGCSIVTVRTFLVTHFVMNTLYMSTHVMCLDCLSEVSARMVRDIVRCNVLCLVVHGFCVPLHGTQMLRLELKLVTFETLLVSLMNEGYVIFEIMLLTGFKSTNFTRM